MSPSTSRRSHPAPSSGSRRRTLLFSVRVWLIRAVSLTFACPPREQRYTGGLRRNASHFAPQSWHAWSSYHQKAKAFAGSAWVEREAAKASQDPTEQARHDSEADVHENDALVQHGFGGGSVRFDQQNLNEIKLGDRAKKSTYQDYMAFLNHGYMQLSTNMLHNHFCENGLTVKSAGGTVPYKIYGDNNMLQKESSEGVRFSAETSNMSRDAVYDWATTGTTMNSTAAIEARLPKTVVDANGTEATLAGWHGDGGSLHKLCWDKVFPQTAAFFSKSTFIASDALVSAKAQEKIMKDVKILAHDGEGF